MVAIAFVAVAVLAIALMPVILVQRYRVGTRRQPARGWLLTVNLLGIALSSVLFLIGAAFTNIWVPQAFVYAIAGAISGLALGMLGLAVTRWDRAGGAWHSSGARSGRLRRAARPKISSRSSRG